MFCITFAEKRGRKRIKRGGPEGPDDERIVISSNTSSYSPNTDSNKKSITEASPLSSYTSPGNTSRISTGIADPLKTLPEKETNSVASSNPPLFSFGKKDDSVKDREAPALRFGQWPAKDAGDNTNTETTKEQFGDVASSTGTTPVFSFLKPPLAADGNAEGAAKPPFGTPISSFCFDISLISCRVNVRIQFAFTFGAPPATTQQSGQNQEGEEEYVPPKPEVVLTEEPNAIFTAKCSVFVLKEKEFHKLGIGQLHIKKGDSESAKKILLIRAATTTGTVWVNTYIDETMKCVKLEGNKLRVSCVVGSSPSTYLVRLPTASDCAKVSEEIGS
ncbi:unnamed protein product [Gongylonema pulchrum]|uniref:RanBD1 domain-containing protein n=1 Tax=Gongylonema pulchrum TaxID=637853 RepID=A0A183DX28_9BILA|nr:unnamed protein product [Gongylonema pulchrum]